MKENNRITFQNLPKDISLKLNIPIVVLNSCAIYGPIENFKPGRYIYFHTKEMYAFIRCQLITLSSYHRIMPNSESEKNNNLSKYYFLLFGYEWIR
jgi:hypothetical protein